MLMLAWAKFCVLTLLADGQTCYWVKFCAVLSSHYVVGSDLLVGIGTEDERGCILPMHCVMRPIPVRQGPSSDVHKLHGC